MYFAPAQATRLPAVYGKTFLSLLFAVLSFLVGSSSAAFAHGMYVFAWPEGAQICAEGYYSSKRKVQGGQTRAVNQAGGIVAQGVSDGEGRWCFTPPAPGELTIIYADDQGHRAEFVVTVSAGTGAGSPDPAVVSAPVVHPASGAAFVTAPGAVAAVGATSQAVASAPPGTVMPAGSAGAPGAVGIASVAFAAQEEQLRGLIRAEMQAQLVPLHKALAERDAPRLRDIVGGLGWIVGLVGIGAYYLQRRERRKP